MPDHSLTSCLCWLEERAEQADLTYTARGAASDRWRLCRELADHRPELDRGEAELGPVASPQLDL